MQKKCNSTRTGHVRENCEVTKNQEVNSQEVKGNSAGSAFLCTCTLVLDWNAFPICSREDLNR